MFNFNFNFNFNFKDYKQKLNKKILNNLKR